MSTKNTTHIQASAVITTLQDGRDGGDYGRIQLFPMGEFSARDGRPATLPHAKTRAWHLGTEDALRLVAAWQKEKVQMVVDYEHQTQLAEINGQPAPAAGWIVDLYVNERGLFAKVEWTARAKEYIKNGEYKYISPTFSFDPSTGQVKKLICAALTNYPALDSLAPAMAKNQEGEKMKELLVQLRKHLQLNENATLEDCTAKLQELLKDKEPVSLAFAACLAKVVTQEHALTHAQKADSSKFVPMEVFTALSAETTRLSAEIATLQEQQNTTGILAGIEEALKDGRLHASAKDWAVQLAKDNPKALQSFLAVAPKIAALKGMQSQEEKPQEDAVAKLSSEDKYAMEHLGLNQEEYMKFKEQA